jgi:hypothetical protein
MLTLEMNNNDKSKSNNSNSSNENIATPEKTAKLAEKYTQYSYVAIEKMLLDNNGSVAKTVNALKNNIGRSNGGVRKTKRRSRKMMK